MTTVRAGHGRDDAAPVTPADLLGSADEVAPLLLGARLETRRDGVVTAVRVVEVEAYRFDDPASHSFRGETARNRTMFGPPGRLYVYRSYGIHWCANVVTGAAGEGSAVLLRAGVPIEGADVMAARRGRGDHLADGPGKLCTALALTGGDDGADLFGDGPVRLRPGVPLPHERTARIGISRAVDVPWRFVAREGRAPGPPAR